MSRPVEQALSNLIPRHNGPLPPELVDLASSLLAQSRVKASTLKPDEEIGRTYVCANIACERFVYSIYIYSSHLLFPFYDERYMYCEETNILRAQFSLTDFSAKID